MEINIMERQDNFLKFEVLGTGHTLLNLLRKKLSEDERIEIAMYSIPHPLLEGVVFEVTGKNGVDVEKEIKKSLSGLKGDIKEFREAWKKAK
ncbi:MAG: DNA-directed RNA polymerase subunit L [Candidatus Altiarchaeota archaeon]|nr:DNA-directed RNA polymerase subunit L [Candidatus Altiarchaeota archaeon]